MREHPSNIKRYPSYKESGIPWLGKIPEHWEVNRGKDLFIRMSRNVRLEDDVVTCFRDGEVTLRRNRRTDGFTESLKQIGYQGIRKGDLVIHQMDAFAGAIGVSDSDGKGTPVYICLQPRENAFNPFFAYLLREMSRAGYIKALHRGIRERTSDFRYDTFSSLNLPTPPLTEQRAIADYLDGETARIDGIVERLTAQRTRYEQLKRSLISEVITKGLPHHDPATFRSLRLKDILFSFESGKRVATNQNEVLSIGGEHIQNGKFFLDNPRYVTEKLYASSNGKIKLGDTLVVKDGATIGKSMYVKDLPEPKMLLNEHVYRLESYTSICMPIYLYFIISNSSTQDYFRAMNMSTAQESITKGTMGNLPIALPRLTEQKEIVDYLDERCGRIDRIVEAIGRKIELLEALRKSIIEEVVTGKRAVV